MRVVEGVETCAGVRVLRGNSADLGKLALVGGAREFYNAEEHDG